MAPVERAPERFQNDSPELATSDAFSLNVSEMEDHHVRLSIRQAGVAGRRVAAGGDGGRRLRLAAAGRDEEEATSASPLVAHARYFVPFSDSVSALAT